MHDGQLSILPETVRTLVAAQFPQWASQDVRTVTSAGTVNAIFRIGDHLAARFGLVADDDVGGVRARLEREADGAEELHGRTRFATPRPVAIGEPGCGYPLPWAVYTWLTGTTATADSCSESESFATDLADFIKGVRAMDTRGRTFDGDGRGGVLSDHDEWMEHCFTHSGSLLDVAPLRALWAEMRILPRGDAPDVMSHSDLIPPNILVTGQRLVGVLDVGGLGAADPALDLVSAWHLLDFERRRLFRESLGCDDASWQRGRAWAFQQAMGAIWYYVDSSPTMSQGCRRTLERIVADES